MRLDRPEIVGEAHGILVPGRPDDSELILRITSEFDDERMPPPEEDDALTPEEIGILVAQQVGGAVHGIEAEFGHGGLPR